MMQSRLKVLASSHFSRRVQWQLFHSPAKPVGARYYAINPFNWVPDKVKEKFGMKMREAESEEEVAAAKKEAEQRGESSIFETVTVTEPEGPESSTPSPDMAKPLDASPKEEPAVQIERKGDSHKYSTAVFKISHRKLNMIGRQISGKPINHAILQMQFSEKRASTRIMNMLATARDHAVRYKGLDGQRLVVAESWVSKGKHNRKRLEPKGRGHVGVQVHPQAKLSVVLKEGRTLEEQKAKEKAFKLKRIVSAAVTREDKPIRNPGAMWAW
ncbi:mitochondrial 50S ribosomal protein L22 [Desarmillaria tabescens]|uniref:Mitochondrial 50S ribosomal protein L22 n=1 Tax=Armillaria tabescens TaxID=1929756 RepID=A0AA39NMX6_ARMTA|nr:mitochondrial 50S ribosomal protein L22 [Desarmillaria tabescens]KAK0468353.1 mitochondrial 50S ribosomal protein L22 [Desarmillaria tabescens]